MPNKGGGGYGGGPYYQGGSGNPGGYHTNNDDNIPVVEATPVAEAIPASASGGGGYAPPTYVDGTYARPPPVSPYSSSVSSHQQQQPSSYQQQQGPSGLPAPVPPDRPPLPLEPYPGAGTAYRPQQQQYGHAGHAHGPTGRMQQVGQPPQYGGQARPVMGQPVVVQPGAGGQPVAGEQLVLMQVNPRQPFPCQCPHCAAHVTTELNFVANGFTFLGCMGLMLIGLWPCAPIPFCLPDCKSAVHVCPRCRGVIAVA